MAKYRRERMSEVLRAFIATELLQLLDPRLGTVTITDVDVSPDLKFARVFWTPLVQPVAIDGALTVPPPVLDEKDPVVKSAAEALSGVKSLLKRRIGEELDLRYVPDILFRFDPSSSQGSRIDFLLDKARG